MLTEFTGCTGVGKTRLVHCTLEALARRGVNATMAYDAVLAEFGLRVRGATLKSVLIDVLLLPTTVNNFRRRFPYYRLAFRFVTSSRNSLFMKANMMRNLLKQVAVFDFLSRERFSREYILLDEGTIHGVHNLFVHHKASPDLSKIPPFLRLVPKPDRVVLLNSSVETVVRRSMMRQDPPRRGLARSDWEILARNAESVFQYIGASEELRDRMLVLKSPGGEVDCLGERVVSFITEPAIRTWERCKP